jgi:hypothetical protein
MRHLTVSLARPWRAWTRCIEENPLAEARPTILAISEAGCSGFPLQVRLVEEVAGDHLEPKLLDGRRDWAGSGLNPERLEGLESLVFQGGAEKTSGGEAPRMRETPVACHPGDVDVDLQEVVLGGELLGGVDGKRDHSRIQ